MKTFFISICCLGLLLALAGCEQNESTPRPPLPDADATPSPEEQSKLPPNHPPIDGAMNRQMPPLPAEALATSPTPSWTVPQGWEQGTPSAMRRASFVVEGEGGQSADIAVTAFPGDVGGPLNNVNRWRAQIGLGAIGEQDLDQQIEKLEIDGKPATLVDFTSSQAPAGKQHPPRMIVVTVADQGVSWFVKMTGDAPLVESQKDELVQFAQSMKFPAATDGMAGHP